MFLVALILLGSLFFIKLRGAGAQSGQCTITPINLNQIVNGELTTSDCRSPLRGSSYYADRYSFMGEAGMPINIGQVARGSINSGDCGSIASGSEYYADRYSFAETAGQGVAISTIENNNNLFLIAPNGSLIARDNARIPAQSGFFSLPATGTYTYSISPASQSAGASGGTGSISVTTASNCVWTAKSNDNWITIGSGGSGTGNGTVNFSIAANSGTARTGTITVAGQTFTVTQSGAQPNPVPAIANISPNAVVAGGAAFTLTVNGMNFVGGSVVRVNGSDRMTTVVNARQLTVAMPAADIAAAGSARITVFNPAPGGGLSNEVALAINSPVTSVSAASFLAAHGLAPESIVSAFGTKLATARRRPQRCRCVLQSHGHALQLAAAASREVFHPHRQLQQSFESLVRLDQAQNRFVAVPVELGPATDDVFLVLYGTGIRLRSSLGMATARIGGVTVPVLFAGATPGLIGLDQINLGPLPRTLAGRGEVDVVLTVDGKVANTVRVSIK